MEEEIFIYISLGIFIWCISDIISSFINFINNEAWLNLKYAKLIYYLSIEEVEPFDAHDYEILNHAKKEYLDSLEREEKYIKIKNKIKSFFKRGE